MHMADWEEKLDAFLRFTGREVLQNAGKVSAEVAKRLAEQQYEFFDSHRKIQEANLELLEEATQSIKAVKKD
ncbi:MAG: RhuM family protein [Syntrophomonadaceae bacterium]|nr:RhuM family protein [Syntrophomonadaceae bacterium]